MRSKSRLFIWIGLIVLLMVGLIFGGFYLMNQLQKGDQETALLQIEQSMDEFAALKNGKLTAQVTGTTENGTFSQFSYQDNSTLSFAQAENNFNYVLTQTSQDQTGTTTLSYRSIDGVQTMDQGEGYVPYTQENVMPSMLSLMMLLPEQDRVSHVKKEELDGKTQYTLTYQMTEQSHGEMVLDQFIRIYWLDNTGLLVHAEEIIEGTVTQDGRSDQVTQHSVTDLVDYNQEQIAQEVK